MQLYVQAYAGLKILQPCLDAREYVRAYEMPLPILHELVGFFRLELGTMLKTPPNFWQGFISLISP